MAHFWLVNVSRVIKCRKYLQTRRTRLGLERAGFSQTDSILWPGNALLPGPGGRDLLFLPVVTDRHKAINLIRSATIWPGMDALSNTLAPRFLKQIRARRF